MRTMWEALKICLPITLMTFAIFTRSEMVVNPGWMQLIDTVLVTVGTCGIAYAMFGMFSDHRITDIAYRAMTASMALVTMFHPDDMLVRWTAVITLALFVVGIWRHGRIASPKEIIREQEAAVDKSVGLDQLAAEARREV